MSGFDGIDSDSSPKQKTTYGRYGKSQAPTELIAKAVQDAIDSEYIQKDGRGVELRPSGFPICSVLSYLRQVRNTKLGFNPNETSFSMSYYCDVGTIVHETIQRHIGNTLKLFGHWKCINTSCKAGRAALNIIDTRGKVVRAGKITVKYSVNNICPHCGWKMDYEEVTIKYKNITGHIDGILIDSKGNWWIIDYKTTSLKRKLGGHLPEKKHFYQLPVYARILEKKYMRFFTKKMKMRKKIQIKGFALIYIPRDNPREFLVHKEKWSPKWTKKCDNIIHDQRKRWHGYEKAIEENNPRHAIRVKPCSDTASYMKKMHGGFDYCPMYDVCFGSRLESLMRQWGKFKFDPNAKFSEDVANFLESVSRRSGRLVKANAKNAQRIKVTQI